MVIKHALTCKREGCKQIYTSYLPSQNAWFIITTYSNEALHCVDNIQITETLELKST